MTDALRKAKAAERLARWRLIRACASGRELAAAANAYMRAVRLTERAKEGR